MELLVTALTEENYYNEFNLIFMNHSLIVSSSIIAALEYSVGSYKERTEVAVELSLSGLSFLM